MSRVLNMRFDSVRNALVALLDGSGGTKVVDLAMVQVPYVGTNPEVGGATPFQLTKDHRRVQVLSPAGAITVKLPTTGIKAGEVFSIVNRSVNLITVQSSGANTVAVISGGKLDLVAIVNSPSVAADWHVLYGNVASSYNATAINQTTSAVEASPSAWNTNVGGAYITSAVATGGGGGVNTGTLTLTFGRAGYYLAMASLWRSQSAATTVGYLNLQWGGTSTRYGGVNTSRLQLSAAADVNNHTLTSHILLLASSGQTLSFNPSIADTFATGTHTLDAALTILPMGA